MRFCFGRILRKYERPYTLIRHIGGEYNSVGVYVPPEAIKISLQGSIQPMGENLLQEGGGKYTEDDRVLFTRYTHAEGDVVEYDGKQYTIHLGDDWTSYADVSEYKMKRVSTHDPV